MYWFDSLNSPETEICIVLKSAVFLFSFTSVKLKCSVLFKMRERCVLFILLSVCVLTEAYFDCHIMKWHNNCMCHKKGASCNETSCLTVNIFSFVISFHAWFGYYVIKYLLKCTWIHYVCISSYFHSQSVALGDLWLDGCMWASLWPSHTAAGSGTFHCPAACCCSGLWGRKLLHRPAGSGEVLPLWPVWEWEVECSTKAALLLEMLSGSWAPCSRRDWNIYCTSWGSPFWKWGYCHCTTLLVSWSAARKMLQVLCSH